MADYISRIRSEVMKRDETRVALQEDRVAQEMVLVEKVLSRINKEEAVARQQDH